jgi:hypothetical protein
MKDSMTVDATTIFLPVEERYVDDASASEEVTGSNGNHFPVPPRRDTLKFAYEVS